MYMLIKGILLHTNEGFTSFVAVFKSIFHTSLIHKY